MVDITQSQALFSALANQFANARQGQGPGQASVIPGLSGIGGQQESAPNIQSIQSGGAIGGGIPGTATTGQSVANSLLGGGAGIGTGDAVAQQVAGALLSRNEPGERGDLGAGVTGGNVGALLSVLGGPLSLFSILPNLVASDALGLPLNPSLLSPTTSLADLVTDRGQSAQDLFNESVRRGTEFGGSIDTDGRITGDFGTRRTAATPPASFPSIRAGVSPGRQESEIDRGGGPGAGPSRGAAGAGNRGR